MNKWPHRCPSNWLRIDNLQLSADRIQTHWATIDQRFSCLMIRWDEADHWFRNSLGTVCPRKNRIRQKCHTVTWTIRERKVFQVSQRCFGSSSNWWKMCKERQQNHQVCRNLDFVVWTAIFDGQGVPNRHEYVCPSKKKVKIYIHSKRIRRVKVRTQWSFIAHFVEKLKCIKIEEIEVVLKF